MSIAKVTGKGRVTIPKEIRERLDIRAGDELRFSVRDDGSIVVVTRRRDFRDLRGAIEPENGNVSIEEMSEAIRRRGSDQ